MLRHRVQDLQSFWITVTLKHFIVFFQDPQGSIPKGTILSIILTSISYVGMAIMAGACVLRDASGNVTELFNGTFTDCTDRKCNWGLQNSFQVSSRYVCSCSHFSYEIYCMLLVTWHLNWFAYVYKILRMREGKFCIILKLKTAKCYDNFVSDP